MRILDRYILKSTLKTFFSCIFIFLFLYVIIDIISHLEDILKNHSSISLLVNYYLLSMPAMFTRVSPFACLLSTLYTLGKMKHDNEIIAMRSSGLSILEISKNIIIFGAIVSLFVFWLNDKAIPRSLSATQKMKEQIEEGENKKKEKKQEAIQNLSMYGLKNRLYFVNKFSTTTNTMEGIIILEHDERQNIVKKIVANKGVFQDNIWRFYQCITYDFDANGQISQEPRYMEEEIMPITETPNDFLSQRQRPDMMSIAQLDEYIWRLSKSGATTVIRNLKLNLYQRFASPLTNVIIIMLGIPFALMMRKRATGLSSIGLSIVVGFLYYVLDAISLALGIGGIFKPILAASLSHIVSLSFSLYLIYRLP